MENATMCFDEDAYGLHLIDIIQRVTRMSKHSCKDSVSLEAAENWPQEI
jgi:hypothetical protein